MKKEKNNLKNICIIQIKHRPSYSETRNKHINNKTHTVMTTSNFTLGNFAMVESIVKAMVKVHAAYNEYVSLYEEHNSIDYTEDYYGWNNTWEAAMRKEADFRSAVRAFAKIGGLTEIRDKHNGNKLNGRESSYAWCLAYNDILSDWSIYNKTPYEFQDALKTAEKMVSCCWLPC